jgi:hypothetical protein
MSSLNRRRDDVARNTKCVRRFISIQSKSSNIERNTNFTARQNCRHDRLKLTIVVTASRNRVAVDVNREKSSDCKI